MKNGHILQKIGFNMNPNETDSDRKGLSVTPQSEPCSIANDEESFWEAYNEGAFAGDPNAYGNQ